MSVRYALISVSDRTAVIEFARSLARLGFTILSTGGTARALADHGLAVTEVAGITGFPEILDGRVKTLHPAVHAGILARRDAPEHLRALSERAIGLIDVVAVNLYPFEATVAEPRCTLQDAIENIDVGGPAMLRSAAKNHASVTVVVDPADYPRVADELQSRGATSASTRRELAIKAFAHTARYDGAISGYLSSLDADGHRQPFPRVLTRQWMLRQPMRYGENPHQLAAFYVDSNPGDPAPGLLAGFQQLQGKELSYNNVADADAAWECVRGLPNPACAIVKHANPCGVAIGADTRSAYRLAFATDPTSAFGGIIAFNREVTADCASAVSGQFAELIVAPAFDAAALDALADKANLRLLAVAPGPASNDLDFKRVGGGLLAQTPDIARISPSALKVVTQRAPSPAELEDLLFAWHVVRYVRSNAIVFARGGATVGIGAGQMSRLDSARIAAIKARDAQLSLAGSAVASDAFFPFRDALDSVVEAGARCVIQPGGSLRDPEVIAAADQHGIAMVLTGMRHFRH
jgi:phosphoribosylaminoimidazolecarboxamide formyltransferase/IMP cyclohydrolase